MDRTAHSSGSNSGGSKRRDPLGELQLRDAIGGQQIITLDNLELLPEPPDPQELVTFRSGVTELFARTRVPGWGAHGEAVGVLEDIETRHIAPNPLHPRTDWNANDFDNQMLGASLDTNPVGGESHGQIEPLAVTHLVRDDPDPMRQELIRQGYTVLCIDGHRRLAQALERRFRVMTCYVHRHADGTPLSDFEISTYWLTTTPRKPPSFPQLVLAFAQHRLAWEREMGEVVDSRGRAQYAFPIQETLASQLGVSQDKVSRALTIAYEPEPVWRAVATYRMTGEAALGLVKQIPDAAARVRVVEAVMNDHPQDLVRPLSVQQIKPYVERMARPKIAAPASYHAPVAHPRYRVPEHLLTLHAAAEQPRSVPHIFAAALLDALEAGKILRHGGFALPGVLAAALDELDIPAVRGALETLLAEPAGE